MFSQRADRLSSLSAPPLWRVRDGSGTGLGRVWDGFAVEIARFYRAWDGGTAPAGVEHPLFFPSSRPASALICTPPSSSPGFTYLPLFAGICRYFPVVFGKHLADGLQLCAQVVLDCAANL
jgi:hypothetical protein